MRYLGKSGAIHKFYSLILTLGIIALLIFAVPAQAFTINLSPPSDPKVVKGEDITFTSKFTIKTGEQVPLSDLYVKINNKICKFNVDGTPIDGCNGIKIDVLKFDSVVLNGNNTFKFKGKTYDYGYGYGYGYGSNNEKNGEIEYKFTIDTKKLSIGKYNVLAEARFGNIKLTSSTHKFEVTNKNNEKFKTIRINSGGTTFKDKQGNIWSKDMAYNTGRAINTTHSIAGTQDDLLYQTQRLDPALYPALKYKFAVPDGKYQVTLYFAETFDKAFAKNKRVFDVSAEGNVKINNLDIYKEVGAYTALKKTFTVDVNDGVLNIDFKSEKNNPRVAAIEINALKDNHGKDD
jgi:hypothetical protein